MAILREGLQSVIDGWLSLIVAMVTIPKVLWTNIFR